MTEKEIVYHLESSGWREYERNKITIKGQLCELSDAMA